MAGARSATCIVLGLSLAGCGSTVQLQGNATPYGGLNGLGPAPTAAGAATSTVPGASAPGSQLGPGTSTGQGVPQAIATATGLPSQPPVSGTHQPLTIGVVLTATSNAQSFGVSLGNTLDEQQVDQAVIDGINAEGGIAGRKVVPVYAKTDTGSANWETDFSAACATFTQDHHVAAVLGYVFNYFQSFESCLARQGIVHLNTGFNIPDRQELASYPDFLAVDTPTIDRRGLLKLEGGVATGLLTAKSKIGVLTDSCPGTPRSLQRTFMPEVARLGLTVVKTITVQCANGNSDSASAAQAVQSAVLQFNGAGVDRVIIHAVSEGPPLLLLALSAESQRYYPTYLVTSLANLEAIKGYIPSGQRPNIHAFGWMANQDIPPSAYPKPNALQARCLGYLLRKGLKPTAGPDFAYAYNFCEAIFLYQKALQQTGGNAAGAVVMTAIHAFGTDVLSTINNDGSAFGPRLLDAVRATRHAVYSGSCTCWVYTGPARPVPQD